MSIKTEPTSAIPVIHTHDVDFKTNQIYLFGVEDYAGPELVDQFVEPGVEYIMANKFIKNLNILMHKGSDPILIHMKTCGGSWEEGMAIYDAIKSCPNRVVILNYTHARSMSSLIFQAADKRVMMPHSTFMFHLGSMAFSGTGKLFNTIGEHYKKTEDQMLEIYIQTMKRKGKLSSWSRERIREWLVAQMDKKEDVFFFAEETVEYGFADEVFGQDGDYNWKKLIEE